MGPELPVGNTTLEKVAEIEMPRFIQNLIYSEPYLLALKDYKVYLIDVSVPSKPFIEDSIKNLYYSKLAFNGEKIFIIPYPHFLQGIIVYNILVKPYEIDTFSYESNFYGILCSKGNVFLMKSNGFVMLNADSMNIVFSFTPSDSLPRFSPRMFADDSCFYYVYYDNTCYVLSHTQTDSIEFLRQYDYTCSSQELVSVRHHYMLFYYMLDEEGRLMFENLENSVVEDYRLPHIPHNVIWKSDFIFSAFCLFVGDTIHTQVVMFGPPYLPMKEMLDEIDVKGQVYFLTSSDDYVFLYVREHPSYVYKLLIYRIVRY